MPVHCAPRNYEYEREVPWGGGPVMADADRPVSFLVRGTMRRRLSQDDSDGSTESATLKPPRGLPPPRLKSPPPRQYRVHYKGGQPYMPDPSEIFDLGSGPCYVDLRRSRVVPVPTPIRTPKPKAPLAVPIQGLSKHPRGRSVPTVESNQDPKRKHPCPVKTCGKVFTKRAHLNRHITSLHTHITTWTCARAHCNMTFSRYDNFIYHQEEYHSHGQEIFFCAAEDEYKGVHVVNPLLADPDPSNIKPFKNIPFPEAAIGLWRFREKKRRMGEFAPGGGDCDRYFEEHPEEMEAALDDDFQKNWRMPSPGPEFTRIDGRCIGGKFKLAIKRDRA